MIRRTAITVWYLLLFSLASPAQTAGKKWYVPDHGKLHFAGGTGFLSAGAGYELFPEKNGEIDLFAGFLPQSVGGKDIYTIAAKLQLIPFRTNLFADSWQLEPLTAGGILYRSFARDLNRAQDPDLYPDGYYWWSIRTRFGPFIGSRITKKLGNQHFISSITLYTELGTNDLYLYSWAANRSTVPFYKIWNSGFGIKATFGNMVK